MVKTNNYKKIIAQSLFLKINAKILNKILYKNFKQNISNLKQVTYLRQILANLFANTLSFASHIVPVAIT
jgi:hypothetical protein